MKSKDWLVREQKRMRGKAFKCEDSWRVLPILETRLAKVPSEQQVVMVLKALNVKVYRGGWPDFLAIKEGKPTLVEVKSGTNQPSHSQIKMHKALKSIGLPVEVVNTDTKGWKEHLESLLGSPRTGVFLEQPTTP